MTSVMDYANQRKELKSLHFPSDYVIDHKTKFCVLMVFEVLNYCYFER